MRSLPVPRGRPPIYHRERVAALRVSVAVGMSASAAGRKHGVSERYARDLANDFDRRTDGHAGRVEFPPLPPWADKKMRQEDAFDTELADLLAVMLAKVERHMARRSG